MATQKRRASRGKSIQRSSVDPAQARRLAGAYELLVYSHAGGFRGHAVEMPQTFGQGRTEESARRNTRAAIIAALSAMIKKGQTPPVPASMRRRTRQVNIRLSAIEKQALEERARRKGYNGISDYLRAVALGE